MRYFLIILLICINIQASQSVLFDGLEWQDNKHSKLLKKNWKEAKKYCALLSLAGKDDWRLPKIKELQNIVNIRRKKPAIDDSFHYTATKNYWSSTVYQSNHNKVWSVTFYRGYTKSVSKNKKFYIRCVRED